MSAFAYLPFAHIAPASGATGWLAWDWELLVAPVLALLVFCYGRGLLRIWRRGGVGAAVRPAQAASFAAGVLVLLAALVGPLDTETATSFSAHMLQHMLLMVVAAPLVAYGAPIAPMLLGLPPDVRGGVLHWRRSSTGKRVLDWITRPPVTWSLYAAALIFWHVPSIYQAALSTGVVHGVEHVTLFTVALLSWWTLIGPARHRRLAYGPSVLYVFGLMLLCTGISAWFTLAPHPLYGAYSTGSFGLTALEDQQMAGVVMGVMTGIAYLATGATLFLLWLQAEERRSDIPHRLAPPMPHPMTTGGERHG
jgi:putative membrane protein